MKEMTFPDTDYVKHIKYMKSKGWNREQICIDETWEFVTTQSLAKGAIGTVINIKCPSGRKINIVGKNQLSKGYETDAHAFKVRFADSDGNEIGPDTRIKIIKEKVSQAITQVGYVFYKDISMTEYLKIPPNKMKTDDKWFRFNNGIEIDGQEYMGIQVINPDICIDAKNVKFSIDIDLWEKEY